MSLHEGQTYNFTPSHPLFIVSACLNTETQTGKGVNVQLWVRREQKEHLFGIINKQSPYITVGLKFDVNEPIGFYIRGKGNVFLSGYTGYNEFSSDAALVHDNQLDNQTTAKRNALAENHDNTNLTAEKSKTDADHNEINSNTNLSHEKQTITNENALAENRDDTKLASEESKPAEKKTKIGDEVSIFFICSAHPSNEVLISHTDAPFKFILGNDPRICSGLHEAIINMELGTTVNIVLPPEKAYGVNGIPPIIPPNATLSFDINLVGINTLTSK